MNRFFTPENDVFANCEKCKLYLNANSPKMQVHGYGKKQILVLAEAPGFEEDRQNDQLVGEAGQLFRERVSQFGMDLDRDCWRINSVNCRPTDDSFNNRTPTKKEIRCCKPYVDSIIAELKPKFIWLMGGIALESFYDGYGFSDLNITKWRGRIIPDRKINAYVCPMFHPSFVLRNQNDIALNIIFNSDLKNNIDFVNQFDGFGNKRPARALIIRGIDDVSLQKPFIEFEDFESKVTVLDKIDEIEDLLLDINDFEDQIYIDYETTGLKPYKEGHKILTIGISFGSENRSYTFPFMYRNFFDSNDQNRIKKLFIKILTNPNIKKIAQNLKFEQMWTRQILGITPVNWKWDTMVNQHILDDRQGVTGLKFQSYVRWGVEGYDDSVKKFIRSVDGTSLGFNRLEEVPVHDLCFYCGMDIILTRRLYEEQKKEFEKIPSLNPGRDLFHEGTLVFSDVQDTGICTNEQYYEKQEEILTGQISDLKTTLFESVEAKKFEKKFERQLLLTSVKDLRTLFFDRDCLNLSPKKKTLTGLDSVDEEVLKKLNVPFTNNLLKMRKLLKIRDTYLAQFKREVCNGKINSFLNLHIARSNRSSSSDPNLQNTPIRDEDAKRITRGGIIPSNENKFLDVDYKQLEFRILACCTKDPVLIDYVNDSTTDIHRDEAMKLFFLKQDEVTNDIRFFTKNGWVFPQAYGSYWRTCAKRLWDNCINLPVQEGITIKKHLAKNRIRNYEIFEEHIKSEETRFWQKLSVTREWQERIIRDYVQKGYLEYSIGFRRSGYLQRNVICNTPIQGLAFHCLLWSLIRIHKILKEHFRTKIVMQIHDSILFDLYPPEQNEIVRLVKRIMCYDISKEFDWLIIPLDIDFEITEVDGSWYTKKSLI